MPEERGKAAFLPVNLRDLNGSGNRPASHRVSEAAVLMRLLSETVVIYRSQGGKAPLQLTSSDQPGTQQGGSWSVLVTPHSVLY